MEKKKLLFLIFIVLSLSFISANLGTFKQGSCVDIKTILNTTNVTISTLNYPDGNLAQSNIQMQNIAGKTWNYTFCTTEQVGSYNYDYFDNEGNTYVNNFYVTATGSDMNTSKAISYVLIFIFSFIIFIGLLLMGIALPSKNNTDETTGYVLQVSNLKYFKIICIGLSYVTATFISYYSWMVSYAYLDMNFLTTILQTIFYILAIATLPLFILLVYILIANAVRDSKIAQMLERGFQVRDG